MNHILYRENCDRTRRKSTLATAALVAGLTASILLTGCGSRRLENELAYRNTGIECMQAGDYAGAVAAFDSALDECGGIIGETELDICYYKAAALYASGDLEGALATYDALVGFDEEDANAYFTRGCLYLQMGQGDLAYADFDKAIENNVDDYELYIRIYENLLAYNLSEQGTEYLNKAFDIEGDSANNLAYRGRIYFLLGEYQNAVTELSAALEKGSIEANLLLGQVYEAQGDAATAETYYTSYVDSGAMDSEAMNVLAEIEMTKGNYEVALGYIYQGLGMEQVDNRRELMQNQIICLEYTGDFNGAWTVVQEYVGLYPSDLEMQREYTFLKYRQDVVENTVEATVEVSAEIAATEVLEATEATEVTETTE